MSKYRCSFRGHCQRFGGLNASFTACCAFRILGLFDIGGNGV